MSQQRYKLFLLFIFVLNYFFDSCNDPGRQTGDKIHPMTDELQVGSKAPVFSLPDQRGNRFNLGDYLGKIKLVVYFYPKDESYGCTKEACSFRDNYEVFKEAGAEVIGISPDDISSHQAFAANHKLPFFLLSDKDRSVAGKYGVGKTLGLMPGRVTFVIDKQGIIRMIFNSQLNYQKHVEEALAILKTMK
jgi:peroxiredoxin Q/BCP